VGLPRILVLALERQFARELAHQLGRRQRRLDDRARVWCVLRVLEDLVRGLAAPDRLVQRADSAPDPKLLVAPIRHPPRARELDVEVPTPVVEDLEQAVTDRAAQRSVGGVVNDYRDWFVAEQRHAAARRRLLDEVARVLEHPPVVLRRRPPDHVWPPCQRERRCRAEARDAREQPAGRPVARRPLKRGELPRRDSSTASAERRDGRRRPVVPSAKRPDACRHLPGCRAAVRHSGRRRVPFGLLC
jgi:hypothetical protein